jgi:hypothetical protein
MSLLTYKQTRPFAREIKRRVALRDAPWGRGAMPPWFLERNIGVQKMKDDISLSDAEIATIAKWADNGAPEGNAADLPKALEFTDAETWNLGKPDFIVSSPAVSVGAVASDYGTNLGKTPIGVKEDRYIASVEFKEVSDAKPQKGGATVGGRFVIHHAAVAIVPEEGFGSGNPLASDHLPIHEVGRNGDAFPEDAGRFLPANSAIYWESIHVHSAGTPGSQRNAHLEIGLRLHPAGYKPKYEVLGYAFGRSEIQVNALQGNQRIDAYFVAPQAMKLMNFEPHMHATGVRMCIEAIYGRLMGETLNCAGYDHNWVRNYQYQEDSQPLIPKGTILHSIGWFDNTQKNENVLDPRNMSTFGNSSTSNMFITFNEAVFLTDQQYREEVKKRKEYLERTGDENIGCPACYLPTPEGETSAARAVAAANK